MNWHIRDRVLPIGPRPLIMGIVNVTPDSFSDGGRFLNHETAIAHALQLADDGADILDIGGESTRPGAQPVSVDEELHRVLPVVEALTAKCTLPLSIDTSKPAVACGCLEAGAAIINDVTALADQRMMEAARDYQAGVILMHMQGTPATMQLQPHYTNVVQDVMRLLRQRIAETGLPLERIAVDPGIGFGKTFEHNLDLLRHLAEFRALSAPICLGVSRKKFLGSPRSRTPEQRLPGSLAVACYAQMHRAVDILRVHDVRETRDAVEIIAALHGNKAIDSR